MEINGAVVNNGAPVQIRAVTGASAGGVRTSLTRTHHYITGNTRLVHCAARNAGRIRGLTVVHRRLQTRNVSVPVITSVRFGPGITRTTTTRIRGVHVGPNGFITNGARCASRR